MASNVIGRLMASNVIDRLITLLGAGVAALNAPLLSDDSQVGHA